jgi:hypothetical protein
LLVEIDFADEQNNHCKFATKEFGNQGLKNIICILVIKFYLPYFINTQSKLKEFNEIKRKT